MYLLKIGKCTPRGTCTSVKHDPVSWLQSKRIL